jgi:hypothetical protein
MQPDIIIFFNSQENINTNMKIFLKIINFKNSTDFTDKIIIIKKSTTDNNEDALKATHKKVKRINI